MSDEPNNKMDALLRAYSQKRGQAPEVPMHPATRRMMQGEVRRVYGASPRRGWRAWWPQLAFGATFCAIIVFTAIVLNRPPAEQQVALLQEAPDEQETAAFLKQRTPAEGSTRDTAGNGVEDLNTDWQRNVSGGERMFTRSQVVRRSEAELQAEARTATTAPAAAALLTEPSADVPQIRRESLARANELTNLGAAKRTRFVQTNAAPTAILSAFQLEQLGEQLRFVDLDGSVYDGELQPATAAETAASARDLSEIDRDLAGPADVYSFDLFGTNLTLGRPVVVHGLYWRRTNAPPREAAGAALTTDPRPVRQVVVGRTIIDQTNQAPLRAISVER